MPFQQPVAQINITDEINQDSLLKNGFVGIHVFDLNQQKTKIDFQSDRYFTPASTVKLFTAFASKKILDEKILAAEFFESDDTLFIYPTGDPTFLHPDFSEHPLLELIKKTNKPLTLLEPLDSVVPYGPGWAWDDQSETYMPARSMFPVYGNILNLEWQRMKKESDSSYYLVMQNTELPGSIFNKTETLDSNTSQITRLQGTNIFSIQLSGRQPIIKQSIPFDPMGLESAFLTLRNLNYRSVYKRKITSFDRTRLKPLFSQSTDTVIQKMLFRSDNFFAEQLLLMCARKMKDTMNQNMVIDSLFKTDFEAMINLPRWVDGSGLSRYNLFTPRSQTFLLEKMIRSFGVEYIKKILPSNGKGTLKSFLPGYKPIVFAKTGSLSNNYCLSGLLTTKKGKEFLFSFMVNHVRGSSAEIRKRVERFMLKLYEEN
jgi:D-alanyl-D-alanine carboxypeptidase/D-alanyl-D-alanine-endopeptidase (penicillin-binding protein 4)